MKEFFKMFFASLLAMVIAGVIITAVVIGSIIGLANSITSKKSTKPNTTASANILVIETDKTFHEQSEDNSLASFSNDISYSAGLYDALTAIKAAASDKDIKGILLKLEGSSNGWATMQQIREALIDFKKSGKKIYAYGEGITQPRLLSRICCRRALPEPGWWG